MDKIKICRQEQEVNRDNHQSDGEIGNSEGSFKKRFHNNIKGIQVSAQKGLNSTYRNRLKKAVLFQLVPFILLADGCKLTDEW